MHSAIFPYLLELHNLEVSLFFFCIFPFDIPALSQGNSEIHYLLDSHSVQECDISPCSLQLQELISYSIILLLSSPLHIPPLYRGPLWQEYLSLSSLHFSLSLRDCPHHRNKLCDCANQHIVQSSFPPKTFLNFRYFLINYFLLFLGSPVTHGCAHHSSTFRIY